MRMLGIVFLLLLSTSIIDSLFFSGLSGGGGGGGGGCGCGGGCGGCGGCGGGCRRKKREAGFGGDNQEEEPFENISANGTDLLCNHLELKRVMDESMLDSMTASKRAISSILESFGDRFVVVCSHFPFEYAVRHDTAYCAVTKGDHTCKAFAL